MVKELFKSFKGHLEDRISNPILGAFGLAWIFINWKIVLLLFFSEKSIEEKIEVISTSHNSWDFLVLYPLLFTAFYLLALPWLLLGVQLLQEKANTQRRTRQLVSDTSYLSAKVDFVRAESDLDAIRLEHDLHREMEIKNRDMELEREKAKHDFEIERERRHMEFDFEERKSEYEDRRRSRELELEHEKNMRQLEFDEKRRQDELKLERYKAETGRIR